MALFQNKKKADIDAEKKRAKQIFDDQYREELREHGRKYFEEIIKDNGAIFSRDLDTAITQINLELKGHITSQLDTAIVQITNQLGEHITENLDGQFITYNKMAKEAQEASLKSLTDSTLDMHRKYQQLIDTVEGSVRELQKNIAEQQKVLESLGKESKADVTAMKESQAAVLQWLNDSAQAMHQQHQQFSAVLEKNVISQQAMLINAFEGNMARIIEHYLLDALGDQYDMKAQLPSIIKQMEANKKVIVEDMKL